MAQQGTDLPAGLRLSCSPDVAAVLLAASRLEVQTAATPSFQATAWAHTHPQDLPDDIRAEAQRSASGGDVSWRLLRRACRALRESGSEASGARPDISSAGGMLSPFTAQGRGCRRLRARVACGSSRRA